MYGPKNFFISALQLKLNRYTHHLTAGLILSFFTLIPLAYAAEENDMDGPPGFTADVSNIPDAIPIPLPYSASGNPPYYDINGKRYYVLKTNKNYEAQGIASWYGTKFQGRSTSSGEPYDMFAMTAASPNLPIPSFVKVTNLSTGKTVIVKVNDRGPFHDNRVMDLSYAAAKKLGIYDSGTGWVKIVAIDTGKALNHIKNELKLYLQVASFRQRSNADLLAFQLQDNLKNPVTIKQGGNTQSPIYRVLIGPLDSTEQSEQLKSRLIAQGFMDVSIRQG